jgi:hypothetical protein
VDVGHHLEDLVDHDRRQAHRRLVQQQHLGARHQRAAHGQHLLLAAAHRAGELLGTLLQAREDREHLVDVGVDLGLVVAREGAHLQVLGDGHAREGAATFGHHHQALLDQVPRALAADRPPMNSMSPDRHGLRAGDGLQRGGLAGAVGADQAHQFALAHLEARRP